MPSGMEWRWKDFFARTGGMEMKSAGTGRGWVQYVSPCSSLIYSYIHDAAPRAGYGVVRIDPSVSWPDVVQGD